MVKNERRKVPFVKKCRKKTIAQRRRRLSERQGTWTEVSKHVVNHNRGRQQLLKNQNIDGFVADLISKEEPSVCQPEIIEYSYFEELSNYVLDILPEAETDDPDGVSVFVDPGGMTHYIHNLYVYDEHRSCRTHMVVKCIQTLCMARGVISKDTFFLTINHNHKADLTDVVVAKLASVLKNRSAAEPNVTIEEIIDEEMIKYNGLEQCITNYMPALKEEMELARGIEPIFQPYVYSLKFDMNALKLGVVGEIDVVKIEDILLLLKEAKSHRTTQLIPEVVKTEPIGCTKVQQINGTDLQDRLNIQDIPIKAQNNLDTEDTKVGKSNKYSITSVSNQLNATALTRRVGQVIQHVMYSSSNLEVQQGNLHTTFTKVALQAMITFYSVHYTKPGIFTAIKHGFVLNPQRSRVLSRLPNSQMNMNSVQIKTESEQIIEDDYHGVMITEEAVSEIKIEDEGELMSASEF